jgi:hypothetical protein
MVTGFISVVNRITDVRIIAVHSTHQLKIQRNEHYKTVYRIFPASWVRNAKSRTVLFSISTQQDYTFFRCTFTVNVLPRKLWKGSETFKYQEKSLTL